MEKSHLPTMRKCKSTKDDSSPSSEIDHRSPKPDKSKKSNYHAETKKPCSGQSPSVNINSACKALSHTLITSPPTGERIKKMAAVNDVTKSDKQSNISRLVKLRPSALSLVHETNEETKYYQDTHFDYSIERKKREMESASAFNTSVVSNNEIDQTRTNMLLFQLRNRQLFDGQTALQYSPKLSSDFDDDVGRLRGIKTSRSCNDRPCRSIMERVKSLDALDGCYDEDVQPEPEISPIYHELDPIDMSNPTMTLMQQQHTYQSINEIREELRQLQSRSGESRDSSMACLSGSREWGHSTDGLSVHAKGFSTDGLFVPPFTQVSNPQSIGLHSNGASTQDLSTKKSPGTKSNSKLFFFSKLRLPKRNGSGQNNTQVGVKSNPSVSRSSVISSSPNTRLIPPHTDDFTQNKIKSAAHSKLSTTSCSSVSPTIRQKFIFVDQGTSASSLSSSSIFCSEFQTGSKSPAPAPHTPPQPSRLRTFERAQTTPRLIGAKTHLLSATTLSSKESIANKIDSVIDKQANISAPAANLEAHSSADEFSKQVCNISGANLNISSTNNRDIGRHTTPDRTKPVTSKKAILDNKHTVAAFKGIGLHGASSQRTGQQCSFATLPSMKKLSNDQSCDNQCMPSKHEQSASDFTIEDINDKPMSANIQNATGQDHFNSQDHSNNCTISWKLKSVESLRLEEELSDYGSCERLNLQYSPRRIAFASPSCGIRMAEMRAIRRKSDCTSPLPEPIISTPPPSSFPRFFSYMQHGGSCNALSENKKDASSQTHVKPIIRAIGICCQQKMHTIVEEDQGLSADERISIDLPPPTTPLGGKKPTFLSCNFIPPSIAENECYANSELQSTIISDVNSTKSPSSHPNGIHQVIQTSPSGHPEEFITCRGGGSGGGTLVTNDEGEKITVAPPPALAAWSDFIDLCPSNSDTDSPPAAIDIKSLRRTCNDLCTSRKVQKKLSDTSTAAESFVQHSSSVQANKTLSGNCTKFAQQMPNFEIRNLMKKQSSTNLDYSEVIFDETIADDSCRLATNHGSTEFVNGVKLGSTEFANEEVRSKGTSKLKPPRLFKCTGAVPAPPGKSIEFSVQEVSDTALAPKNCSWKIVSDQKRHSLPDVKSGIASEIQAASRCVASKQFCNASCDINDDSVTRAPPKQQQQQQPTQPPMITRDSSESRIMQSPEISRNRPIVHDRENHKFDPSSPTKLEPLLSNFSDLPRTTSPPPPPSPRTPAAGKTPRYGIGRSGVFYNASVVPVNRCSADQKQSHTKQMKSPRTSSSSPHSLKLSSIGGGAAGLGAGHCDRIDISRSSSTVNECKNSSEPSEVDGNCPRRGKAACSSLTASNIPLPCASSACMTLSGDGGLSVSSSSTGSSIVSMVSSIESETDFGAYGYKRRWPPVCEKSDKMAVSTSRTSNLTGPSQKSATLQPLKKYKLPKGGKPQGVRSDKQFKVQAAAPETNVFLEDDKECLEFQTGTLCSDRLTRSTQNLK